MDVWWSPAPFRPSIPQPALPFRTPPPRSAARHDIHVFIYTRAKELRAALSQISQQPRALPPLPPPPPRRSAWLQIIQKRMRRGEGEKKPTWFAPYLLKAGGEKSVAACCANVKRQLSKNEEAASWRGDKDAQTFANSSLSETFQHF